MAIRIAKEMEKDFDLPKGVRQIGEPGENSKIYIEDHVIIYLKKIAKETDFNIQNVLLYGNSGWIDRIRYFFIKSVAVLKNVQKANIEYYPDQYVLGVFFLVPRVDLEWLEAFCKDPVGTGSMNFVVVVEDSLDGKKYFFTYENGRLTRQRSYYIFYEQNEDVQHYMVEAISEVNGEAKGIIETGFDFGLSESDILERLQRKLKISLQVAQEYLKMFGK